MAGLRDKAQALKRDHILEAAVAVFAAHGFQRATMKQVAERAGVAEGTIYTVFANKADLLRGILGRLSDRTTPDGPVPAEDPLAARLAVFTGETLDMMRVVLAEAMVDGEVREMFQRAIIAPMLDPEAPQTMAAVAMVCGLVLLRLLGQSDPRGERAALALLGGSARP